jgi:hypothetical protein
MQRGEMPSCLTTTLYDLITAIQAVVDPHDDALAVATVVYLLRSGRLTWRGGDVRKQSNGPLALIPRCHAC